MNLRADPPPTIYITDGMNLYLNCLSVVDGDIKGSDGIINITDGNELRITGDWINNSGSDFLSNTENTIVFNSNTARQSIEGSEETSFYNLKIDAENHGIDLNQNISISSNLSMTDGNLDLQYSEIDLGGTGNIIDESENNPIKVSDPDHHTGTIKRTAYIDDTQSFTNPGNIGVSLKPTGALGNVTITRGHQRQQGTVPYDENFSIARYFEITPDNNDIETEMKFYFWDNELPPHNATSLIAYRYINAIEPYWNYLTEPINAGENNFVEFTTPGFSKFTLGSEDNPLPVDFLYFTAKWSDNDYSSVQLVWETASEINSNYYEIHRSNDDMISWQNIKTVEAAGFSSINTYYEEYDNNPPNSSDIIYYRLKQVDFDNTYDYSNIVAVAHPDSQIEIISIYPNPADKEIDIEVISAIETNAKVYVLDNLGRKVCQIHDFDILKGRNIINMDISLLKPAIYTVQVITESGLHKTEKQFIKK